MEERSEYRFFCTHLIRKYGNNISRYFNFGYGKPNIFKLREVLSEDELHRLVHHFNQSVRENEEGQPEHRIKKMLIHLN